MSETLARDPLAEALTKALGPDAVFTGDAALERAQGAWMRLGTPVAVVCPKTTEQVSAVLKIAHGLGVPVVPWGGKTGLAGGATADGAIALSLEKMNAIEEIDVASATMTVQAGCILQVACEAAEAQGLLLPLDLGARGSATIGGNISTNAGGNRVVRYGMMRDMVLGLEAVLADGTVVTSMNRLMKNNTGYDLKQLFIGSEGTLGVVTRAVLRLRSAPISQNTAYVATEDFDSIPRLLRTLESGLGGSLSAFEVMWPAFYDLVTTEPARGTPPLARGYPYYVLVESLGGDEAADAERFERVLGRALEDGLIVDAVIAKSQGERARMWALRDDVGQVNRNGPAVTFDVSLRIADMPAYVAEIDANLRARWPKVDNYVFGHLGDGNLHVLVWTGEKGPETKKAVEEIVYGPLKAIGGSVSAEHGIGLHKKAYLPMSRNEGEIALMKTLKVALDPKGILNPGKILD
ncbi:MAG: FAD-binding oxidoreductase [Phenylobacterium sp.]|uniref:FAD-binding oxidoreductase n=1 Tax=Phenylobacterium sp. TaxID=1871053 RepID=UPI001A4642BB|nr:FAD-binding oxidoreductase [Phenylobacterium sp.]MBL8553643.1 FAD-binding oxidoreductase [Phenylobacterium sp.]